MNFGDFVRYERERRGWSLGRLEAESGISDSTLFKIEKGDTKEPRREQVDKLAKAFKIQRSVLENVLAGRSPFETSKPTATTLLPHEEEMLDYFRSLPVDRQQEELVFFRGLARRQGSSESEPQPKASRRGA